MFRTKAKKSLGQHFLTDIRIAHRIVRSLNPQAGDQVIEVGPGKGILTGILLEHGCRVKAVELDNELVAYLEKKFPQADNLELRAGDFLNFEAGEQFFNLKIVGNLPYNIATAVIARMFIFKPFLTEAVFMVQEEVARRLTAASGGRDNNAFALIMAAGFDIKILFKVAPTAFRPRPKVMSAVIKLKPVNREPEDFEGFKVFLRGCFRHKRKTLVNSMQNGLDLPKNYCKELVARLGKSPDIRAEQLSFEDYINLYRMKCAAK